MPQGHTEAWKPPAYAKPVSTGNWKPPTYAIPMGAESPSAPQPPTAAEAAQTGMTGLERAWNWLTTPPAAGHGYETIPEEVRSQISNWAGMHLPPKYAPTVAQVLDILATPIASVEEAGRRMASPLGLATVAAGGALPKVMPAIAEASPLATKGLSALSVGAAGAFGLQGAKQAASGLAPGLTVPERIERIGTGAGQAILGTAGAVSPVSEVIEAGRVPKGTKEIFKAARPSPKEVQFRENIERSVPDIAQTFRESPIESTHGGQVREVVDKLRNHASEIWQNEHEPLIEEFGNIPIDTQDIAASAGAALGDVSGPQADPANVAKAQKWIENEFSKPMNLRQADQLRRDLKRATQGRFGELSAPEYEAKKAALSSVRQHIYHTLEDVAQGSNIRSSNMRYGALNNLADVLERRINIAESQPGRLGQFGRTLRGYVFDTLTGGALPSFGGGVRVGQAIRALRGGGIGDVLERGIGRIARSRVGGPEPFRMPINWGRRLGLAGPPTWAERIGYPVEEQAGRASRFPALPPVNPAETITMEGPGGEPITTEWRGTPTPEQFRDMMISRGGLSPRALPAVTGGPFEMPPSSTIEVIPPAERVPGKYAGLLDQNVQRLSPRSGEGKITPREPMRIKGRRYHLPPAREQSPAVTGNEPATPQAGTLPFNEGADRLLQEATTRNVIANEADTLRVAQAIARLDGVETVGPAQLGEAIQYGMPAQEAGKGIKVVSPIQGMRDGIRYASEHPFQGSQAVIERLTAVLRQLRQR